MVSPSKILDLFYIFLLIEIGQIKEKSWKWVIWPTSE